MDRQRFVLLVLMQCVLITYCMATKHSDIATDQSTLLALKAYITSDPSKILSRNWTSASASSSVCDWFGIRCGTLHRRVTALNISGMGLMGTIPPHLGNLSFLVSLDMSHNYFHGILPQELSRLRKLRYINLYSNHFRGSIPTWLGPKLQALYLGGNKFAGAIPSSIFNLSRLEVLNLYDNLLTGEISKKIGNLKTLRFLDLEYNFLVGSIPFTIFNVSTLEEVSVTFNNLTGNFPGDICHYCPSLKVIRVSYNQLNGQISSNLSHCSQLQRLSLSYNNFSGPIPKDLGNLEMLEVLYLGGNNLQVGSFELDRFQSSYNAVNLIGVIPREIGNLHNLQGFSVEINKISGPIPKQIWNLTKLTRLSLYQNFLTGVIPREMDNLGDLRDFNIQSNRISGKIPEEIGNLHKLEKLDLSFNDLSGFIPNGIFNLSTLTEVYFGGNQLTGNLPSDIGYRLPNLGIFDIDPNNIGGVIPVSIGNCSKLTILSLTSNQLTGSIPNSLGNLVLLKELYLEGNYLTGDPTSLELDFLTSLTNCKSLTTLYLGSNPLNGILPNSIANLSTSLEYFVTSSANIRGSIPRGIGNLSSLIMIQLRGNQLTEAIPREIQKLENLEGLYLMQNKLRGTLDRICNIPRIYELRLSGNQVSGSIPDCFGNTTSLRKLDLSHNLFTSSIPRSFFKLVDLMELNLTSNSFNGSLPMEIGNLKVAVSVDLSKNQISGPIPSTLDDLQNLQNLSLANNQLEGSIPESFKNMISLTSLDLSHNNLSGFIPKSLEALVSLKNFNVSFNHLRGEIPSLGPFKNFQSESFDSNDALCGDPKFHVPPCKTNQKHRLPAIRRVLLLTLIPLMIVALVVLAFTYIFCSTKKKSGVSGSEDVLGILRTKRISYYELLQATNGYNESNLLGSGCFGSVYKGLLGDGKLVAVKVFNLQLEGSLKSFDVECEVLRNLRHRNLVKVISSCSNQDFKALVLEYISNGSLEKWLHSDNLFLTMLQRLNIMIDVASALHYLHEEYSTPVVHCDLKPNNILIDEELVGHVSDFGIAKFLGEDDSIALTKTMATIGYMAPEYGREGLVSKACDVFSYGILLMEVFTGKRPNDEIFDENMSLKSWVNDFMPNSIEEIIDGNLLKENEQEKKFNKMLECLPLIMELALKCVRESPKERLTIGDVVDSLKKIKVRYVA